MNILVNFLAIHAQLPKEYTSVEVPDGIDAEGLLRIVYRTWKAELKDYADEEDQLLKNVIMASNHKMVQMHDKFDDGQKVTIIGQIIGG